MTSYPEENGGIRFSANILIYALHPKAQAKKKTNETHRIMIPPNAGKDSQKSSSTIFSKTSDHGLAKFRSFASPMSTSTEHRPIQVHGYARVSTNGQSLEAQLEQLRIAGCTKVFCEKISGVQTNRPELERLLDEVGAGDVVLVTRLDRLARSTRDLLNTITTLSERGASFRSLADAWADTTTPHGRLMLTVLGGLAEYERELIRARTMEGRERAKARGVRLGRKPKLSPQQRQQALRRRLAGEHLTAIAQSYRVSPAMISRLKPKPL